MNAHLTDDELQEMSLDFDSINTEWESHTLTCPKCKAILEQYVAINKSLKEAHVELFPFDVGKCVLESISRRRRRRKVWYYPVIFTSSFTVVMYGLNKLLLPQMFQGMGNIVTIAIFGTCFILMLWFFSNQLFQYKKKIQILEDFR